MSILESLLALILYYLKMFIHLQCYVYISGLFYFTSSLFSVEEDAGYAEVEIDRLGNIDLEASVCKEFVVVKG